MQCPEIYAIKYTYMNQPNMHFAIKWCECWICIYAQPVGYNLYIAVVQVWATNWNFRKLLKFELKPLQNANWIQLRAILGHPVDGDPSSFSLTVSLDATYGCAALTGEVNRVNIIRIISWQDFVENCWIFTVTRVKCGNNQLFVGFNKLVNASSTLSTPVALTDPDFAQVIFCFICFWGKGMYFRNAS